MEAQIAEPRTDLVPAALLEPVVAYFRPRRVILFGSRARGDHHRDSDYDLLVILDDDAPADKLTSQAGYESRKTYLEPTDIIPCRESVFLRKARIPGTLSHEAALEGIVVYERLPR
jgi:hypothetical protein